MSQQPIRVSRKEFRSEEVLDRLDEGRRVIVTVGVLGVEMDVALRKTDGQYVCDTGMKLMSYDDREGMQRCIERLQLTT
ncbi:hypothetical protein JCM17823_26500 [Halorubrum gandharaense]